MKRDLTQEQFEHRATKAGFRKGGFMGYWALAANPDVHVSVWNAGKRRRNQLNYLRRADKSATERKLKELKTKEGALL